MCIFTATKYLVSWKVQSTFFVYKVIVHICSIPVDVPFQFKLSCLCSKYQSQLYHILALIALMRALLAHREKSVNMNYNCPLQIMSFCAIVSFSDFDGCKISSGIKSGQCVPSILFAFNITRKILVNLDYWYSHWTSWMWSVVVAGSILWTSNLVTVRIVAGNSFSDESLRLSVDKPFRYPVLNWTFLASSVPFHSSAGGWFSPAHTWELFASSGSSERNPGFSGSSFSV